jgi:hypothetical protein
MEMIHAKLLKAKTQRHSKKLILRINKIANYIFRHRLPSTRQLAFTFKKRLCRFILLQAQM